MFRGVNNEFSTKRVAFVLAVLVGLGAPTVLAFLHWKELGSHYLTYMAIVVPSICTLYGGGKWIDKLPNRSKLQSGGVLSGKKGKKSALEFQT